MCDVALSEHGNIFYIVYYICSTTTIFQKCMLCAIEKYRILYYFNDVGAR